MIVQATEAREAIVYTGDQPACPICREVDSPADVSWLPTARARARTGVLTMDSSILGNRLLYIRVNTGTFLLLRIIYTPISHQSTPNPYNIYFIQPILDVHKVVVASFGENRRMTIGFLTDLLTVSELVIRFLWGKSRQHQNEEFWLAAKFGWNNPAVSFLKIALWMKCVSGDSPRNAYGAILPNTWRLRCSNTDLLWA